ncbi:MAG: ABC transporter substrate-binding protein [Symploca sp. SIO3C6]|nr:ABC transporter substrate-binding protein [Symploca sp. SIO3C6]
MHPNLEEVIGGRYRIFRILGSGGFAQTYLAQDEHKHNRCCVVKLLQPQSCHPGVLGKARELFKQEAKILHQLGDKHPQIPQLLADFEENQQFYLVQEYIEGYPLSEELTCHQQAEESQATFNQQQVIQLLRDILEILEFVHKQGIIHRDIKPSNLMRRNSDGKIVLIDFGAVKQIVSLDITSSGEMSSTLAIGTNGYMPVEQMEGYPQFNSDIYAVGMVAIEALTGLNPQNLPIDPQTLEKVWRYSVPDRAMPKVGDELAEVLDRMVRRNFNERYQSVTEVLQVLKGLSSNEQAQTKKPSQTINLPEPAATNNFWLRLRRCLKLTRWLGLGLAALAAAVIFHHISLIIISKTCPIKLGDYISCGEEALLQISPPVPKQMGVEFLANSSYKQAVESLIISWKEQRKDPETLIYLNNALLEARGAKYYTIAVVVPTFWNEDTNVNSTEIAQEVLRGVAQAQTEVNLGLFDTDDQLLKNFPGKDFLQGQAINNNIGLRIVIADDTNKVEDARQRAKALAKQQDILGVIGHYTSTLTLAALDIYQKNKLVLISPGAVTEELSGEKLLSGKPKDFFFRTVPRAETFSKYLAEYLRQKAGQEKAVIFYNDNSSFSYSLWREYTKSFTKLEGKVVNISEYKLYNPNFNVKKVLEEVSKQGEATLVLFPDAQVNYALDNALNLIKANNGRNWIAGGWTLYNPKTLAIADLKLLEKLVLVVPWHPLNSPNPDFSKHTQRLWGKTASPNTATAYDTTRVLIKALETQDKPTRIGIKQTLADPNFSAYGATGKIEFDSNGNRQNPPVRLVHIVPCSNRQYGLAFVPINSSSCK